MEPEFDTLKMEVGRPTEETIETKNLKPLRLDGRFQRRFNEFFNYWDRLVTTKANRIGKQKYRSNMEEFYGEILEKFEGLSNSKKKVVLGASKPLKKLYKLTNLSEPNVFHNEEDNEFFINELKETKL